MNQTIRPASASRLRLLRLEPRLLFDAAAATDASEALRAEPPPPWPAAAEREVAFIDASTPDAAALAAGVRSGVEVALLQPGQDPWTSKTLSDNDLATTGRATHVSSRIRVH